MTRRPPKGWLTLEGAAQRVGRSKRTIQRWISEGNLGQTYEWVKEDDLLELARQKLAHRGRPRKDADKDQLIAELQAEVARLRAENDDLKRGLIRENR